MKKLLRWLSIVAFPIALAASTSQAQEPQATYRQDSIRPYVCDWPQKGQSDEEGWWCGAAALQANVEWAWRDHRGDTTHYYAQSSYWNHMRDDSCSDVHSKDAYGRDIPLPGTVGNRPTEVRELNIAYDFGTDPHALAWTMWEWGPASPTLYNSTRRLAS
jgi:hypothetical protein